VAIVGAKKNPPQIRPNNQQEEYHAQRWNNKGRSRALVVSTPRNSDQDERNEQTKRAKDQKLSHDRCSQAFLAYVDHISSVGETRISSSLAKTGDHTNYSESGSAGRVVGEIAI
jgi:hypothetical protein